MALFRSLNQLTIISGTLFLPSVKMAAGARLHHGAHAVRTALPLPVLPRDGTAPSLAAPRFWHPRPHPLSGCPRPFRLPSPEVDIAAWRRGRRGECFRGSGPWVGVCKLASVPAGAAAATGLAQCAGVWRRRRAAGETAGGRSWQVGARSWERSVVQADGSASAARRPWGAAREGGGEGRRGAWRKEGARGGKGAARAPRCAPAASPARERGACLEGRGREHAPCALLGALRLSSGVRGAGSAAGWLEGGRERSALGFACLPSTSAASSIPSGRLEEHTRVA